MNAKLPSKAGEIAESYPKIWKAYAALGKACAKTGPLKGDAKRLVKLALAIGAGSEGAVHSHARRALDEGLSPAALKQVALLAIPTLGFPRAVAAYSWIEDVTD
jgi:alkylhydroperoxidase/carboxymuconolactone decarboxylase family protein YurZ